mgnify:CR=1 FL=1
MHERDTPAHGGGFLKKSRVMRRVRRLGRNLLLFGVGLPALAALVRALAGLPEAATLLAPALVAAMLTLPRGLVRHWRGLRRDIHRWLQAAAQYMEAFPLSPENEQQTTTGKS